MTTFNTRSSVCDGMVDYMKIQDEDTIEFWRDPQEAEIGWPMEGFSSEETSINQNNWSNKWMNENVIKVGRSDDTDVDIEEDAWRRSSDREQVQPKQQQTPQQNKTNKTTNINITLIPSTFCNNQSNNLSIMDRKGT